MQHKGYEQFYNTIPITYSNRIYLANIWFYKPYKPQAYIESASFVHRVCIQKKV